MNFLAHSLFGFDNPELVVGQFCGDFVRGSDLSSFPAGVEQGIRLHRHLDQFTDKHASLTPVRQSMPDVPRRFAGIVVDVLFDHYLALRWEQISDVSLEKHEQQVIRSLYEHEAYLPDRLIRFTRLLERECILQNNVHLAAIELTLARIAKRSERFAVLALNQERLDALRDRLEQPFDAFFPQLQKSAKEYIAQSPWSH